MIVVSSRRVEKALKKINASGRKGLLRVFAEAVDLLIASDRDAQSALCIRFRDHALHADKRGLRELHLDRDVLLVYQIHESAIVELQDIVSHEELGKRG